MSTEIWTVTAEFVDRDDAVALIDLVRELGFECKLGSRSVNAGVRSPIRETRVGKLILGHMLPGRSYDLETLRGFLEENGYDANSAGPAASVMTREGDLRRVGHGVYQLVSPPVGRVV